jgi:secernin
MLFGKNSDRQRNEAQAVELIPRAEHAPDTQLRCTYITIPQVPMTHAVLACRPFWIWGAEMGVNEHGVAIGNEALRARVPPQMDEALTGMDLLRLALERATTAVEAVEVITGLLRQYGQGGNCGHMTPSYYNNGFMIADPNEAFVLETVGQEWLLERVRDIRTISNRYSIDGPPERVSEGLPELVGTLGWHANAQPSHAEALVNLEREHIGNAGARRARSTALLRSREGTLDVADMMRVLRDHDSGDGYSPECTNRRTVCMHAGASDRPGQTVGSLVSELRGDEALHWVTASAAPCTSVFKPVLLSAPLPETGRTPTDRFDPLTLWWRHERLHRAAVFGDFAKVVADIAPERDALEAAFRKRMQDVLDGGSPEARARAVTECWHDAIAAEERWYASLAPPITAAETACMAEWARMNRLAEFEPFGKGTPCS